MSEKWGMENVLDHIIDELDPNDNSLFHLSFDVDGIDPSFIPSTGTTAVDGLSLREGTSIVRKFFQTKRLKTFDLVEINPNLGGTDALAQTKDSIFELLSF